MLSKCFLIFLFILNQFWRRLGTSEFNTSICLSWNTGLWSVEITRCVLNSESTQLLLLWCGIGIGIIVVWEREMVCIFTILFVYFRYLKRTLLNVNYCQFSEIFFPESTLCFSRLRLRIHTGEKNWHKTDNLKWPIIINESAPLPLIFQW